MSSTFHPSGKYVTGQLSVRTPNLADRERWIVAKNEGSKVADITLERVGKWPTYFFF